ncbi:hypothetical protein [Hominenteromicrobium sp.]|jgi:hypothetical protein|uniref:hypothetical protein n=1 Tax=Hominenteromicrobium sp. TaxID=3073581 RepID=UPI003A93BCB2
MRIVDKKRIVLVAIVLCAVLFALLFVNLISILIGKFYMRDFFKDWQAETDLSVAELVFDSTLHYDGKTHRIYSKSNVPAENYLTIYKDRVYYVLVEKSEDETVFLWNLFSRTVSGSYPQLHCSFETERNFQCLTQELYKRNRALVYGGYYYKGQIVLRDEHNILVLNLSTGSLHKYLPSEYGWPKTDFWIGMDYGRNQITIGSRGDGITQVIDAESTMNTSPFAERLLELVQEKIWNGKSRLDSFPQMVYVFDDRIYIIGSVMNDRGYAFGITFELIPESRTILYTNHAFVGDTVATNYHLIPVAN